MNGRLTDFHATVDLVTAAVQFLLAALTFRGARHTPLGLALLALSAIVGGFCAARGIYDFGGGVAFHYLHLALFPFSLPAALWLVAIFVGKERRHVVLLASFTLVFPLVNWLPLSRGSSAGWTFLVAGLPALMVACRWLLAYRRSVVDPAEQSRAQLLLVAVAVGALLGPLDFLEDVLPTLRIGNLGLLFGSILVGVGAVRFNLLGTSVTPLGLAYAFLATALAALGGAAVFSTLGAQPVVVLGSGIVLGALVLLVTRRVLESVGAARERRAEFVTLGLLARQMSHDIRNPLAALKGVAQLLQGEPNKAQPLAAFLPQLDVLIWQVERIDRLIGEYQRLGRVECELRRLDLNTIVLMVAEGARQGAAPNVRIDVAIDPHLPEFYFDEDLVVAATENLIRNALESTDGPVAVKVRTVFAPARDHTGARGLLIVEDNGKGMDPRTKERAFDMFFTTKQVGTGLGLPFIRRIVLAHGGHVDLETQLGRGTTVTLGFPLSDVAQF